MSKRKISLILFLETLLIGIISLVVGLGVGVILSQFMSILVANMFDANMKSFAFTFSSSAMIKTILYFSIMYLIVMLFNTISINKCKLIDLLHAEKKSEEIKLKNPTICTILFIIGVCMLSYAYYLVTAGFSNLNDAKDIIIPIALGSISTFIIFWASSGLILRIVSNMKNSYYKGLNSFVLRQFSSKINTTVFSTTIICLMLFITICVLSSSLTVKNSLESNANLLAPRDIQITKTSNLEESNIIGDFQRNNINLDKYFKDLVEINIYQTENLTLNHTLGTRLEEIRKQFYFLNYDTKEDIIKISDYNKVAELYDNETYTLNENEYIIVADFDSMVNVRNIALNSSETINLFGKTLTPKYKECQDGFIEMAAQHINSGIIVVPDNVIDETALSSNMIIADYIYKDKNKKQELEDDFIEELSSKGFENKVSLSTRLAILEASIGLGALITFIGLYLGIIFLISSAAILALKELSESSDNKNRFRMLRKIGADERLINKALFKEMFIFFTLPLALALIHSIFGMMFSVKILEVFGTEQLLKSIIMTIVFFIFIYGGYFLITYQTSKSIIRED